MGCATLTATNVRNYVVLGDEIAPGRHIADSGDTGRSGAPHLHLELRVDGQRHCPQPLLMARYDQADGASDFDLPSSGCSV
jgi:murein DD-endopeptidase MepM/ murein hydrolase activator NlpD